MDIAEKILRESAGQGLPPVVTRNEYSARRLREYTAHERARIWRDYYRALYFRAVIRDERASAFGSMVDRLVAAMATDTWSTARQQQRELWLSYYPTMVNDLLPSMRKQVVERVDIAIGDKEGEAHRLAELAAAGFVEEKAKNEPSEVSISLATRPVLSAYSQNDEFLEDLAAQAVLELGCADLPHMWLIDLLVWEASDFILTASLHPYRLHVTDKPWRNEPPPPRPSFAQTIVLSTAESDEALRAKFQEGLLVVKQSRGARRGRPRWDGAEPPDHVQATALYRRRRGTSAQQLVTYMSELKGIQARTLERNLDRLQSVIFTTDASDIGPRPILPPWEKRQSFGQNTLFSVPLLSGPVDPLKAGQ